MLKRTHVAPFLRESGGLLSVEPLADDAEGRVLSFLDRLCRLVRRLEGAPRATVVEALRRQERRVRDRRRLDGLARTLLDACRFVPHPLAARAPAVREAVFAARGRLWPPTAGDADAPYREAAAGLDLTVREARDALYSDRPDRRVLARAPAWDGRRLLDRYNLELARAVLLDAVSVTVSARGGWGDVFRAVKLARLMYRIERAGRRRYRVELTGPASPFIARPRRYGIRFARVFPAISRAPGWRIEAEIAGGERPGRFVLEPGGAIRPPRGRGRRYDSRWERDLAAEFGEKLGEERGGWTLSREDTPVAAGEHVFLPDFTLRHTDGREALVEIVGFWTPEYLREKVDRVRAAGLDHLVLVVYRGLGAGATSGTIDGLDALPGAVLWFARKPRIGPVLEAADRVARVPGPSSGG
ncbi:MAG TPA: DUF790 family protein [Longimicrobiales bacterium]|nr:DUF790 family protein [Longimicrobiales bacterium]